METITKVALVVGGLIIANKVLSKPKTTTTTESGEESNSGSIGGGGGGGFPMIPTLGFPILPLGLAITKIDAELKAEAEAKVKAEAEAKARAEAEAKANSLRGNYWRPIRHKHNYRNRHIDRYGFFRWRC